MHACPTAALIALLVLGFGCASEGVEGGALAGSDEQPSPASASAEGAPRLVQESCGASSGRPRALTLRGNLGTHDPALIAAGGRYWLFQTGKGVYGKVSTDLVHWDPLPSQLASVPDWLKRQVPRITQDLWAPDVSYFGGKYHLYYSGSTYMSETS